MLLDTAYAALRTRLVFDLAEFVLLAVFIVALLLSRRKSGTARDARRRTLVLTICLAVVTFACGWLADKPMADVYSLRHQGEKYIGQTACTVAKARAPKRGDKTVHCKDGTVLIEDPRRFCFEKDKTYKIDYLPATRLILRAEAATCGKAAR